MNKISILVIFLLFLGNCSSSKNLINWKKEQIKIEEYLIRNKGLKLRNIETQETLEFKDFRYKFPYDRDTFLKLAIPYSKHGELGTLKDFSYIDNIEGLDISRDGDITLFYAKNGSEKIWNDLETAITLIWDS